MTSYTPNLAFSFRIIYTLGLKEQKSDLSLVKNRSSRLHAGENESIDMQEPSFQGLIIKTEK